MRALVIAVVSTTLLSLPLDAQNAGQDARAVIDAAAAAMGTTGLQSIQYTGTGSINSTGQAYQSGGAWPRYTLKQYTMSINYTAPAARQELVRLDDEKPPRGGGAGGFNPTTFQGGIRPVPGDISQNQNTDGRTEVGSLNIWLTPHGFLKGAVANAATAQTSTVRGKKVVSFTAFGKYTVTGTLNAQNLVEHVETTIDVPYTGDTVVDGTYSEYKDFGSVKFPTRIVMREGTFPTLDLSVRDVQPNNPAALQVAVGNAARGAGAGGGGAAAPARPEPQPEKIANGVWFLTPGIEGSILVEFRDYLVMVEGPAGEAYTTAALASAKRLVPGKPVKYLVNTHHHADHAGGLRAYVAEGIPIITHESHKRYYEERIFRNPHSLNPDRLARAPRPAMIETLKDTRVLTDGTMTLELHLLRDQLHAEGLLIAYIPNDQLLIQADTYVPRPGAPPLPAVSPITKNLVDNVTRLQLNVTRVAHIHGGMTPYSDVLKAGGR